MKQVAILMVSIACAQPVAAQASAWTRLANVSAGTQIKVDLLQPKGRVEGRLSAWDENGITVQSSSGTSRTIAKTNVRKIQAKGRIGKYAPLIGAAAGALALGFLIGQPRLDFVPSFVALCAVAGGAAGFGIGVAFRYSVVYEAP